MLISMLYLIVSYILSHKNDFALQLQVVCGLKETKLNKISDDVEFYS